MLKSVPVRERMCVCVCVCVLAQDSCVHVVRCSAVGSARGLSNALPTRDV